MGIQSCGNNREANVVLGIWGVALQSPDFGSLYNKFYDETKHKPRKSLKTAEIMVPCLWVVEIGNLGISE